MLITNSLLMHFSPFYYMVSSMPSFYILYPFHPSITNRKIKKYHVIMLNVNRLKQSSARFIECRALSMVISVHMQCSMQTGFEWPNQWSIVKHVHIHSSYKLISSDIQRNEHKATVSNGAPKNNSRNLKNVIFGEPLNFPNVEQLILPNSTIFSKFEMFTKLEIQ